MTVVAGIDLAAGRGISEVALLAVDEADGGLTFDLARHRRVGTDDEIVAVLLDAQPAVIAVDAPLSLPRAVQAALRGGASVPGDTPYTRQAERDPQWSALGVRPLPVSFLGGLTFRAIVLAARLRAALPEAALVETFPTGVFRVLGLVSRARKGRGRKTSPEARQALQAALLRGMRGMPVPALDLLDTDLLDALGAALAAAYVLRGRSVALGDADEGTIVLPALDARLPSVVDEGAP